MFLPLLASIAFDSSRLQIGTTWAGNEVIHYASAAAEIDETHRFKIVFRVTGKAAGMWIAERRSNLLGSRVGNDELPPPPVSTPFVTKSMLSPAGFLMDEEPFEKATFALDRLFSFWLPSNNPDIWSADLITNAPHSVAKCHVVFKLSGRPTDQVREYTFTCETPGRTDELTASGAMRFDVRSGRLLQVNLKAKNAVVAGGTDRVDVTLTYTDSPVS